MVGQIASKGRTLLMLFLLPDIVVEPAATLLGNGPSPVSWSGQAPR